MKPEYLTRRQVAEIYPISQGTPAYLAFTWRGPNTTSLPVKPSI